MQVYAIGDIHGHLSLLHGAHELIARDRDAHGDNSAPIIHIGDLVDRGPDSPGVLRYLREGIARGENWDVLLGNHDRLLLNFVRQPDWRDPGLRPGLTYLHPLIGGRATLQNFGVDPAVFDDLELAQAQARDLVPAEDLDFLAERPRVIDLGAQLFVHAGLRPGRPLEHQTEDDLLWIRDPFLQDARDHGPLIVHGHTALPRARHYRNRLNIDSSAAYGGPLSAVVLEGRKAWLLTPAGRVELVPA
ncbi:metallophosphoesterase [Roseibaca sp. Y0-43]|uniref:metallophosphoesterase n=1 Tax=Roseibaca sp. Y0-43 TaxID=2816854 RepID=UPI001D0CC0D2|nr:metallophosphoesterase [Roseibaca sp. Y0-43]MCC1480428.1 metallophosphoesterase [Roseibaca sp. Y0-43]